MNPAPAPVGDPMAHLRSLMAEIDTLVVDLRAAAQQQCEHDRAKEHRG